MRVQERCHGPVDGIRYRKVCISVRYRKGKYRAVRGSSALQQSAFLACFELRENRPCDSMGVFPLSFLLPMHDLTPEPSERKTCLFLP